jgi:patatin-like phospholipase/acyl hydrolase
MVPANMMKAVVPKSWKYLEVHIRKTFFSEATYSKLKMEVNSDSKRRCCKKWATNYS